MSEFGKYSDKESTQALFTYISNLSSDQEKASALEKAEKSFPGISDEYKLNVIAQDSILIASNNSQLNEFAFKSGIENKSVSLKDMDNPTSKELIKVVESMSGVPIHSAKKLDDYLNLAYQHYSGSDPDATDMKNFSEIVKKISPKRTKFSHNYKGYRNPEIAQNIKSNKKLGSAYDELLLLSKELGEK